MRKLTAIERTIALRWFSALPTRERRALRQPRSVFARFVEPDEPEEDETAALYEYFVNHEVYLGEARVFHICSAHPDARAALATAHLPASFSCPLDRESCPMRALLAENPGRDVRFVEAR